MTQKTIILDIQGMTCDRCATTVENVLDMEGVLESRVRYPDGVARVTFEADRIDADAIATTITKQTHYTVTNIRSIEKKGNPEQEHLIILGGGSAAFAATIQAHELGARVTMINDGLPIGGTCVNVGCVPSKNLIRAAEALHKAQHNPFPGIVTRGKLDDFASLWKQKEELVGELRQEKYINIIKEMDDLRLIRGRATLVSQNTVAVKGETITGDKILIATGARPFIPPIPGLEDVSYLTNTEAFALDALPESLIVLGGRYIALEIAQLFSRLGSRVTILQRSDRILPTETPPLTEALTAYLQQEGIELITGNRFLRIDEQDSMVKVETEVHGIQTIFRAEKILVATGRIPNTNGMGLEKAGVRLSRNQAIEVNDHLATSVPTIYAAGDVLGENMFVYTAAYEGQLAARNALTDDPGLRDYSVLPWVIFTDPQVTGVGLDEVQAAEQGISAEATVLPLEHVPRAIAARDTRGFIKLIRDRHTDQLIGARILAPEGAELIMEVSLAIRFGITVRELVNMFHPYLTLSEGIKLAAITFGKDITQLSCCAT